MYSGIRRTFEQNCDGFWLTHWEAITLFLAMLLFDAVSTTHAMKFHGTRCELHPLVRLYSDGFGLLAGPLVGACFKAAAGILVAVYFLKFARFIFIAVAITALLAACYNMWASELYLAGILPCLPF